MSSGSPALEPVYSYGDWGSPIPLFRGQISLDGDPVNGSVDLNLMPRPSVDWRVDAWHRPDLGPVGLVVALPSGDLHVDARCSKRSINEASGHIRHADVGDRDAPLTRVIVHWLNLPEIHAPHVIYDATSGWTFGGRWMAGVGGWQLTMDRRADHPDVWRPAKRAASIVMTHVMEIRRLDAAEFTAADVEPVLDALHLGFSFALGRWVAPILPVGLGHNGERLWEQWGARLCTNGAPGALRWWFDQREWELAELLGRVIRHFAIPADRLSLRFLLSSAVHSAGGGFVEQRIMTAFSALEHLMWRRLVVLGPLTRTEFQEKSFHAARKLARVLRDAAIPEGIDVAEHPPVSVCVLAAVPPADQYREAAASHALRAGRGPEGRRGAGRTGDRGPAPRPRTRR